MATNIGKKLNAAPLNISSSVHHQVPSPETPNLEHNPIIPINNPEATIAGIIGTNISDNNFANF